MEVNRVYTYDLTNCLQTYTDSQDFLGMAARVEAVDTRPLPLLPRGLGTRLRVYTLVMNIDLQYPPFLKIMCS